MSKKSEGPKRLLDYEGLANYLSIGRSNAYELVKGGAFVKIKIGARVLFDVQDVDAYIERVKRSA